MGNLFVPNNFLETCQGMQEALSLQPPDEQDRAGAEACNILGSDPKYYGAKKLELHTLGAYAFPNDGTFESTIYDVIHFGEMRIKGHLSNVAYARIGTIKVLTWMMMDVVVRDANGKGFIVESDNKIRRPLHLPVGLIESALLAS